MSIKEEKKSDKVLASRDEKKLSGNMNLGMSGVDTADIRPPSILLIQALSKKDEFIGQDGKHPKNGEFFHNGTLRIMSEFECYFIWAAKGQLPNKRQPEKGAQDVYRAIGIMADDFSIFGMMFKSSSLYALSGLFTAVSANKRGMYSIKCKVSAKFISGEKGEWFVPAVKVYQMESDQEKLTKLENLAKQYNKIRSADVEEEEEELLTKEIDESNQEKVSTCEVPF